MMETKFILPEGTTKEELIKQMILFIELTLHPELADYGLTVELIEKGEDKAEDENRK